MKHMLFYFIVKQQIFSDLPKGSWKKQNMEKNLKLLYISQPMQLSDTNAALIRHFKKLIATKH